VLLDNEDLDASIEARGFTENMVREERACRPASDDGNAGALPQSL